MYQYGDICAPSRCAWHELEQKYDILMMKYRIYIYILENHKFTHNTQIHQP